MSKQTQMVFACMFLFLGVGFTEIFLSTKLSRLEYKFKTLNQRFKKQLLLKNKLENQLDKKLEVNKLLNNSFFKTFKKVLPKDILVIKFRERDADEKYFVQKQ